jgi:hypothetical protein
MDADIKPAQPVHKQKATAKSYSLRADWGARRLTQRQGAEAQRQAQAGAPKNQMLISFGWEPVSP